MKPDSWFKSLNKIITGLIVTDVTGCDLGVEDGFQKLVQKTLLLKENQRRVYMVGNGASASMASHIAADLCKNAKVKTDVFTDPALITALVNDLGVENMFSEPLRQQAVKGDALFCISSSGNSINIINAVKAARENGIYVITLTGMEPDNKLRSLGDLNFYIPATTYGFAESGHAAILHYWVDEIIDLANIN